MMKRFLAGLLLVAGGAAIAVGASLNWVTFQAAGSGLNGFTIGTTPLDAVVSFALAGLLILSGSITLVWPGRITKALGTSIAVLAVIWAGGILFLLSPIKHEIDHLVSSVSFTHHLGTGYFLTAGGALGALLGALAAVGIQSPRKVRSASTQIRRDEGRTVGAMTPSGRSAAGSS